MQSKKETAEFLPYLERYSSGEWRAPIFRDLILNEVKCLTPAPGGLSFLDIGCGTGFDDDAVLQRQLAQACSRCIGIEPDQDIQTSEIFAEVHRCRFEDAPIAPESIDVAFSVMVLEHAASPQEFWDKLYRVLRPGGIFWGFTVDARHPFVSVSLLAERFHLKDRYLDWLHGKDGEDRYENYGVFYRSNTPDQIRGLTKSFRRVSTLNFQKKGQCDYYFPAGLRWLGGSYDRVAMKLGWPGSLLAVRAEK